MPISIIVCATKPDLVEELRENISATIGKDTVYEIIAIDNTSEPRAISEVYNEGGRKARYENLLFIHQDAGFVTKDWLKPIETKLQEDDCGVIGFAGTKVFYNYPSGWGHHGHEWMVAYFDSGVIEDMNRPERKNFAEVVAVDGYAMFVRKDVWHSNPFDEKAVTGFHGYDIDFSLSMLPRYKNYVCCCVLSYHYSPGNFDDKWAEQTIRLYNAKWKNILPLYASDVEFSPWEREYSEERACFRAVRQFYKLGAPASILGSLNRRFLSYPLTPRHFEHLLKFSLYQFKRLFRSPGNKKGKKEDSEDLK